MFIYKVKKIIDDPGKIILYLADKGFFNFMSDKSFLKMIYRIKFKKKLDLQKPVTYNEKLQWLKLYDRKQIYTTMVDKHLCKKYVSKKIGSGYVIPTLGVWDSFDDIDFDKLPKQFVLKCTHDSGGLVICKDKSKLDLHEARRKICKSLKCNYYYHRREWPYKNVKPRIIAEQYMVDESGYELKDYKFFCFNGKAKLMFIASDRSNPNEDTKFDFYDMDFNHLPFTNGHPNSKTKFEKPLNFEEMVRLAEILSSGIPQARIDFYNINNKIYFGEITLFHWSGFTPFNPPEWDRIIGEYIQLPKK